MYGASCGPDIPCDAECQQQFFTCFRQLHRCAEICEAQIGTRVECIEPSSDPTTPDEKVILTPADCARCKQAYAQWIAGKDCDPGMRRCAQALTSTGVSGHLLQICIRANNRQIWSEGKECTTSDTFPCKTLDSIPHCVGCQSDDDCPDTDFCDTTQKHCIQCVEDADCKESQRPICSQDGRCVQCTQAQHCKSNVSGTQCIKQQCVCVEDKDCPSALSSYCHDEKKRCVQCLSDTQCGQRWWSGTPTCENSICICQTDDDCKLVGQTTCRDGQCQSCQQHEDCASYGADTLCIDKQCQITCQRNADCSDYRDGSCLGGRCTTGCLSDSDCARFNLRYCRERRCLQCIQDDDCPNDKHFCLPPLYVCVQCRNQADCRAGQRCIAGVCS